MKKNKILWVMLFALCSIFANCKKDQPIPEEQLPPETQTGAFTFGCKVDGKIYTAKGRGGLLAGQHVTYGYYIDSTIIIDIGNTDSKFNVQIVLKYLGSLGIYTLNSLQNRGEFYDNSNGSIPGSSNTYTTDNVNTGNINIKYFNPVVGSILAGTFEMNASNGSGKIIHITEGRFDIGR